MIRELVYRVGRKMYMFARGDNENVPEKNGEYWLLEQVVQRVTGPSVFLDIGSNKGDWSAKVFDFFGARDTALSIYAFEPSSYTRGLLAGRFSAQNNIHISDCALSNEPGLSEFFIGSEGAGTNSLHEISGEKTESINISTLDIFLEENDIVRVDFGKIDTEGFDALVIEGAIKALEQGKFDLLQFEYNWRWLLNSKSLRDVFQLIENTLYSLGQLSENKILIFDKWHYDMDRFFGNNYVLVRKGGAFDDIGIPASYDLTNTLCY